MDPSSRILRSRVLVALLCAAGAGAAPSAARAGSGNDVLAFAKTHCISCHDAEEQEGDLDLEAMQGPRTFEEDRELWEKVVAKLKTGRMPPPSAPRPPVAATDAAIRWLEAEFARQDALARPDPGHVAARRLNRTEYDNTLRDLLGVDLRLADAFPADGTAFGFDNVSDALLLSPAQLESYVTAAGRAVRAALFGPERLQPAMVRYSAPVRNNQARGTRSLPENLHDYDLTGLSTLHAAHFVHRFPVDAEYSFRLVLNGHRPNGSEPVHPALFIDGKLVRAFEVDATDLEGQEVQVRARVAAGERLISATYLRIYHGLPPSYGGPAPSRRSSAPVISTRGQLSQKEIALLRKLGTRIKTDAVETRVDARFEAIQIGGPFRQKTGPSRDSLAKVYVCGHAPGRHTSACPRTIIESFATRAFRRPATPEEVERFLSLVRLAREQGDSLEEGIAVALQAILVSPSFLYRLERDRPGPAEPGVPLGPYELASRLSYFLWSSTPDDELLRLAGQDALRDPAVLEAQVRRMLRDPRSAALAARFAGQWLQFDNLDAFRPDLERFPAFDDGLRRSMRRETELFFDSIVREDRSVLELLDADHTFVDERLARFYGIPGVAGPEMRRVSVAGTPRGGGVLAHASILASASYSTRTSPVLRGRWILETLLHDPPPPPPPGVPPLAEEGPAQGRTLRQQMEEHRKNPTCASCHVAMDALGFGLENFDAIGAWRTHDGEAAIDASGTLPDGRSFRSPAELKALLRAERDAFVRGLTEKLMIYALGRGVERFDRPAMATIVSDLQAADYRFSALALGIVRSLPFQMRRAAAPGETASR